MFNALARGKFSLQNNLKEDTLTSSVLDYILLLPDAMIWQILRNSNQENSELPDYVGKLIDVNFWPNWDTTDVPEVNNSKYIEPDVFLIFENADVIIEAKRYDRNQQSSNQWTDQIKVYKSNLGENEEQKLIYFALGGLRSEAKSMIEVDGRFHDIHKLKWRQILELVNTYIESINKSLNILPNSGSYLRILQTIIDALALHGYYLTNHSWLEELSSSESNYAKSIKNISIWNPITT